MVTPYNGVDGISRVSVEFQPWPLENDDPVDVFVTVPKQKNCVGFSRPFSHHPLFAQASTSPSTQPPSELEKFFKKFPKDTLPEKAQENYDKILKFSQEKGVPFLDINILLDNLSKLTKLSLKELSPYIVLMQWGTYALLWDLKYNIKAFQEGEKPVKLPDFLEGKIHEYPEIVMDHLLEGHIRPNPRWANPTYSGFVYMLNTNEYWAFDSVEYVLDPTNFHSKGSIYHEMYHAYQDANGQGPLTDFEEERDARFIGNFAAIKAVGFPSEAELIAQFSPKERVPTIQGISIGKEPVDLISLPPQSSFALATYHFIHNTGEFERYQSAAEEIIRKREGFAKEWAMKLASINKLNEEALRLFPHFPITLARKQILKVERNIEKIVRDQAGLDIGNPGALEQWHQFLADRLKILEPKIRLMGGYDKLSYEERELVNAFLDYFTLAAVKYGILGSFVEAGEEDLNAVTEKIKAYSLSPLSRYSPHFFRAAKNNWVGPPKIKHRPLQGNEMEQFLFRLVNAQEGLFDSEWNLIHKLAAFCDREKIPMADLEQITKNMPDNIKNEPIGRWQSMMIRQWYVYCLMYATFKKRNLFDKKTIKKVPPDAHLRWNEFVENVLVFIKNWKVRTLNGLPQDGIYYDFRNKLIRIPFADHFMSVEDPTIYADLLRACHTAYLVSKISDGAGLPINLAGEVFCWWLIAKQVYGKLQKGRGETTSKEALSTDILKYLRTNVPETKKLSLVYHSLAADGSDFSAGFLSGNSATLRELWNKIQANFSIFATSFAISLALEQHVDRYWKEVAALTGLDINDNTLRWSQALKTEWDYNQKRPDENNIEKYSLIVIVTHYVSQWDLLGLPHDFQGVSLPDPEDFFEKHLKNPSNP